LIHRSRPGSLGEDASVSADTRRDVARDDEQERRLGVLLLDGCKSAAEADRAPGSPPFVRSASDWRLGRDTSIAPESSSSASLAAVGPLVLVRAVRRRGDQAAHQVGGLRVVESLVAGQGAPGGEGQ
jgi:hypothetical protein